MDGAAGQGEAVIQVRCTLRTIEQGKNTEQDTPILVLSHWNAPSLVVLEVEGQQYVVGADDLITAVQNATHSGKR